MQSLKPTCPRLNRDHPLVQGLVLAAPLADAAGNVVSDLSGCHNHGTFVNSPQWDAGPAGATLRFNGSNAYCQLDHSDSLNVARLTLSVWANQTSLRNENDRFIVKGNVSTGPWGIWGLRTGLGSYARFRIRIRGTQHDVDSPTPVLSDRWTHWAGTYDGQRMRLYRDGQLIAQNTIPTGNLDTDTTPVRLAWEPQTNDFLHGFLDDVRIYSRDLSDEEIAGIYADPWAIYRPRTRLYMFAGLTAPQPYYRPRWYAQPVGAGLV